MRLATDMDRWRLNRRFASAVAAALIGVGIVDGHVDSAAARGMGRSDARTPPPQAFQSGDQLSVPILQGHRRDAASD